MKPATKFLLAFVIVALIFFLDQWSKKEALFLFEASGHPSVAILPFFNLVLVRNYGISFGMFAAQNQPLILVGVSAIVSLVLLVWLKRTPSRMITLALPLVIGGAVGNSYDRLTLGSVVDFLDFYIGAYHWPAFNIADSSIFIGVVLLCIHSMFIEPKKPQT